MARVIEAESVEVIETGSEPEYFVSKLLKYDHMPNGLIRLYFASQRAKNVVRLEYSVIISKEDLVFMAREAINIVGDAHNEAQFRGMIGRAN
jgi:hypothetical protein